MFFRIKAGLIAPVGRSRWCDESIAVAWIGSSFALNRLNRSRQFRVTVTAPIPGTPCSLNCAVSLLRRMHLVKHIQSRNDWFEIDNLCKSISVALRQVPSEEQPDQLYRGDEPIGTSETDSSESKGEPR